MSTPEDVLGHRSRLRQKVLTQTHHAIADYEVLECLLGFAIPRKDVKPLAKELIKRFRSIGGVFCALPEELMTVKGIKETTATLLRAIYLAHLHALDKEIVGSSIIEKWQKILDYYYIHIGRETRETFHVLFLNAKTEVIADEEISKGTVNQTPIYPREIIARALALGAVHLILVHNHPSGSAKPSQNDIDFTVDLYQTCQGLSLRLYDHVIISRKESYSFREHGCPPYELKL